MRRKAFITGIDGFTGRHLARELLAQRYEVCGLARKRQLEGAPWRVHEGDLLDQHALSAILADEKPDILIHLAAIAFIAHGDIGAVYQTNIVGTRNVLDAAVMAGCARRSVLIASSANVYGNAKETVIDETVRPQPVNDYAISKLAMEHVAHLWAEKLPITIVRPFNYTGVGQATRFLLPKIIAHYRERRSVIELGNLDVIRDFSDVRSTVSAYARLLTGDFAGKTFNVCSGLGYSLKEILSMMSELTGHHPQVRVNPALIRATEVYKLIGDNSRLRQAIGGMKEITLRETLQWMLAASGA